MTTHTDPDRYPIYEVDGTWYYRASALGGCINELVLMKKGELGEDKSPYIGQVLQAGHDYEAIVKEKVAEKAGMVIVAESESVGLEIDPGHIIVGNTDGKLFGEMPVLGGPYNHAGVEIKTLGEDAFASFVKSQLDRFPEYQWQVSIYMYATGMPFLVAAAPRLREKDEQTGEWDFWVDPEQTVVTTVLEPPIALDKIRRKVRRINTLAEMEMEDLPVCEKTKFCSMARFHDLIGGNAEAEEAEVVGPEDALYALVLQRRKLKQKEDEVAAKRKEVDDELKRLMEGPVRIPGLGRLVPVLMPGRTTYDTQQMAMDLGPETMEKYEKQGSPFAQLRWYEEKK